MAIGPSILEQEDALKGLPTQALQQMMRQPSPDAPPFLVAAELKRREQMKKEFVGKQAQAQTAQQAPTVAHRLAGQQQPMPMSQAGAMAAAPQQPPMPKEAQLAMALSGATGRPPPELPTVNMQGGTAGAAVRSLVKAMQRGGTRTASQMPAHRPFSSRERPAPVYNEGGLGALIAAIAEAQSEKSKAEGGFDISEDSRLPRGRSGARAAARPVTAANGTQGRTVYAQYGYPNPLRDNWRPPPSVPPLRSAAGDFSSRFPLATPIALSYLEKLAAAKGRGREAYGEEQDAVLEAFGGRQNWFDALGVGTGEVPDAPPLGPQELPVDQAAPLLSPEQKRLWQGGWVDNPPIPQEFQGEMRQGAYVPPPPTEPTIPTMGTQEFIEPDAVPSAGAEGRVDARDEFIKRVDEFFSKSDSPEITRKRLWDLPIEELGNIVTEWGPHVATKEDMSRRDDAARIWGEKRNAEAARELAMPSLAGEGPPSGQRFNQETMVPIPPAAQVPDARDPRMMAPNPRQRFNPATMVSIPAAPPPRPPVNAQSLEEDLVASGIVSDSGGELPPLVDARSLTAQDEAQYAEQERLYQERMREAERAQVGSSLRFGPPPPPPRPRLGPGPFDAAEMPLDDPRQTTVGLPPPPAPVVAPGSIAGQFQADARKREAIERREVAQAEGLLPEQVDAEIKRLEALPVTPRSRGQIEKRLGLLRAAKAKFETSLITDEGQRDAALLMPGGGETPISLEEIGAVSETAAAEGKISVAESAAEIKGLPPVLPVAPKVVTQVDGSTKGLREQLAALRNQPQVSSAKQVTDDYLGTLNKRTDKLHTDLKNGLDKLLKEDAADLGKLETRFKALDDFYKTGKLPERMRKDRITNLLLEMSKGFLGNQNLYDAFKAGVEGFQAVDKAARGEYAKSLAAMLTASKGIIDSKMAVRAARRRESIAMTQFAAAENRGNATLAMDRLKIAEQARQNVRTNEINLLRGEIQLRQTEAALAAARKGTEAERVVDSVAGPLYQEARAMAQAGDRTLLDKYFRIDAEGRPVLRRLELYTTVKKAGVGSSIGTQLALARWQSTGRRDEQAIITQANASADKLMGSRQDPGWVDVARFKGKKLPTFDEWKDQKGKALWKRWAREFFIANDRRTTGSARPQATAVERKQAPDKTLESIIK